MEEVEVVVAHHERATLRVGDVFLKIDAGQTSTDVNGECEWLVTNGVLPTDVVTRDRRVAEAALRPWTPVFTHGDLRSPTPKQRGVLLTQVKAHVIAELVPRQRKRA